MPALVSSSTGNELDAISDLIDDGKSSCLWIIASADIITTVNVLKGKTWDEDSEFDTNTDKTQFRDYDAACDRVKAFYKEQHGKIACLQLKDTSDEYKQKSKLSRSISKRELTSRRKNAGVWAFGRLLNY